MATKVLIVYDRPKYVSGAQGNKAAQGNNPLLPSGLSSTPSLVMPSFRHLPLPTTAICAIIVKSPNWIRTPSKPGTPRRESTGFLNTLSDQPVFSWVTPYGCPFTSTIRHPPVCKREVFCVVLPALRKSSRRRFGLLPQMREPYRGRKPTPSTQLQQYDS